MERSDDVVAASPRERRLLVVLVALGAGVLAGSLLLPLEPLLRVVTGLFALVGTSLAYANVVTARENGLQAARQAVLTRATGAAPVVTLRVLPDLTVGGSGDEFRLDLDLEVENHGTTPAVATIGRPWTSQPSTGSVPSAGPLPLPPRGSGSLPAVRRVPVTLRIPRAQLGTVTKKHGTSWPVVVPLTVENTTGTVTDEYRLSFELRPHPSADAWVLEKDPGYAFLVRRVEAEAGSQAVPPPDLEHRLRPASPPPSPRRPLGAGSRRP